MTQAVTVYRWDDPGAPQIVDGKPSEYMTVLKKCLVEGYGSKLPLGWLTTLDERLTATPYLALKNDTAKGGSGGFITFGAVDDNGGTLTKVQCCQSFIDKTNLINPGSYFVYYRYTTGAGLLKNWMIIGTETAFYLFVTSDSKLAVNYFGHTASIFFFAGDFQSNYSNDLGRFVTLTGSSVDAGSHGWYSMLNNKVASDNSSNIANLHPLDGSSAKTPHGINSVIGNAAHASSNVISASEPSIEFFAECYLVAGAGSSIKDNFAYLANPVSPYLRGKVPGLLFTSSVGYKDKTMPHILSVNGVNYFQIPSTTSSGSGAWINLEQW